MGLFKIALRHFGPACSVGFLEKKKVSPDATPPSPKKQQHQQHKDNDTEGAQ
jgi:hypothetical protein